MSKYSGKERCICGNIASEDTKWGKICRACLWGIKHEQWDSATIAIVYGLDSPEDKAFAMNEIFN